ncbi:hypothetical protein LTR17_004959 [Elasticomyces elasticus]|nr:hypothetical protein LTR17_004959 [Elasticomyces elasticus]
MSAKLTVPRHKVIGTLEETMRGRSKGTTMYYTEPIDGEDGEEIKFTFICTNRDWLAFHSLLPINSLPQAKGEVIDVDAIVPSTQPTRPQPTVPGADVTYMSTTHTGQGTKKVKAEESENDECVNAKYRMLEDMDQDDEEMLPPTPVKNEDMDGDHEMDPGPANRASVFGDDEAYGITPQPEHRRQEPAGSAPPPYASQAVEQVIAYRSVSVQPTQTAADSPHGLSTLFRAPSQAVMPQPAQPQLAGTVSNANFAASPSTGSAQRAAALERLSLIRTQDMYDLDQQLQDPSLDQYRRAEIYVQHRQLRQEESKYIRETYGV